MYCQNTLVSTDAEAGGATPMESAFGFEPEDRAPAPVPPPRPGAKGGKKG